MIPNLYQSPNYGSNYFVQGFMYVAGGAPTTVQAFTPGSARANNNDFIIQWPGNSANSVGDLSVNLTTLGAGGVYPTALDDIIIATVQAFPVVAIADSSGYLSPKLVVATSNVGFLPPGYDTYAWVNTLFINSSSELVATTQTGYGNQRTYTFNQAINALTAGNATARTPLGFTNFGISSASTPFLGPGGNDGFSYSAISKINLLYSFTPGTLGDNAYIQPVSNFGAPSVPPYEISPAAAAAQMGNIWITAGYPLSSVFYNVTASGDSLSLWVAGLDIYMSMFAAQSL